MDNDFEIIDRDQVLIEFAVGLGKQGGAYTAERYNFFLKNKWSSELKDVFSSPFTSLKLILASCMVLYVLT